MPSSGEVVRRMTGLARWEKDANANELCELGADESGGVATHSLSTRTRCSAGMLVTPAAPTASFPRKSLMLKAIALSKSSPAVSVESLSARASSSSTAVPFLSSSPVRSITLLLGGGPGGGAERGSEGSAS